MKDWSALAAASGINIPSAEMERMLKPLQGLEESFRPLANSLTIADEPAVLFDPTEDGE